MIKIKTFFSMIGKLAGKEKPKTSAVTKSEREVPVPSILSTASTSVEKSLENSSPHESSVSTQSGHITPSQDKSKKKPGKTKVDKKGIPIITENDDFGELFQVESAKKKKANENFDQLFQKSHLDLYQRLMLMEKKKISEEIKSPILIEKLKAYPGPQGELDLHGFSAAKAESATEFFIRNVRHVSIQTVRIIVGKGTHSEGKAVLPDVVESKIIELKRRDWVLNYKWEKKDKSKSGSMIVYLIPSSRKLRARV